ncbi:hypothetical protein [Xenorhabdus budapestensis]|uniref:Polyketide cyclase n=1 Tax=Xenorhabdus budapestensis TaxID=290110 RepID=A0A2D0J0K1_XENBU|nr:hypothetical protein [Xenorhabdus budapestensis]PHM27750.1 hypothetical protein Xbud_02059 [Xenorhabdus budapestensis]QTL38413.1 hypothetical protein HGO23_10820 [Xenorhabdus budapestensis]
MLTLAFSSSVNAKPSCIWAHYVDFNLRRKWEIDLESFQFEGEIKTGQYGRMVLSGMPEIRFYLLKIEINKEFTDQVSVPNIGILTFCHQIIIDENKIARRINLAVSLEPDVNTPVIQSQDLFKQVTHDLVETVLRLKAVVE